jgi:hypothetical protein
MKSITSNLKIFVNKLPPPTHWKFWVVMAIFAKTSFFIFKVCELGIPNLIYLETFASDSGDTTSYIEPIENLLKNGVYYDDFRMPGYGWLYFLLRLIFSQTYALNTLVIIQLLLSSLSVYTLALISDKIFKHNYFFYSTFFLYAISSFVSLYDHALLTESFCTSAIIFSVYFLFSNKKLDLIISGMLLTWAVFLKPVMVPLIVLFGLYVLVRDVHKKFQIKSYSWCNTLLFLLPFFVVDGAWVIRNFQKYDSIIPLTKSVYYPDYEKSYHLELFAFMNSFGGSIVHWEPGSEITFFSPLPEFIKKREEAVLPNNIYTSKFNYDSLIVLRELIKVRDNETVNLYEKQVLDSSIKNKFNTYTKSIKQEKPFLYYIGSRFKVLKTFFVHSGTYNLFNKASFELNKIEFVLKLFYSTLYLIVVIFGFIGSFTLLLKGIRNIDYLFISCVGLYIALVFPFILKLDEFRYFVPGYPFFLIASIFAFQNAFQLILKKIK